jgi:hypothetical protein
MELGIELYIVRVPTKDNLSDDPSRERYGLIEHLGVSALVPDRQPGLLHALMICFRRSFEKLV